MSDTYVVTYMKVVCKQLAKAYVENVYIGGIANSIEEANILAKDVVKVKGSYNVLIMPTVTVSSDNIVAALDRARAQHDRTATEMYNAADLYSRAHRPIRSRAYDEAG